MRESKGDVAPALNALEKVGPGALAERECLANSGFPNCFGCPDPIRLLRPYKNAVRGGDFAQARLPPRDSFF